MNERNIIIEEHYRNNYEALVKKMVFRVSDRNRAIAEEVVQEAYSRALKYYNTYNPELGEFGGWFTTILNNCLNQIKNEEKNKGIVYELDNIAEYTRLPEQLMIYSKEEEERLRNELYTLIAQEGVRDRMLLTMFFIDGFGMNEIGEFLGMSHVAVRKVVSRWREKIIAIPS